MVLQTGEQPVVMQVMEISLGLASCKNSPTIGPERWETAFELLQLGPLALGQLLDLQAGGQLLVLKAGI